MVTVPFAGLLQVPVTIWVLAGPFSSTQQTALLFWQTAQLYFTAERLGVRLDPLEVVDATTNSNAAAWSAFSCGAGNANVAALQAAIGARPGRINVYLVGLVDGSTSRGNACNLGGGFVAIAAGAGRSCWRTSWDTISVSSTSTISSPISTTPTSCIRRATSGSS